MIQKISDGHESLSQLINKFSFQSKNTEITANIYIKKYYGLEMKIISHILKNI